MTEEWRPVPGYEGCYEVSSLGRVRNIYWRRDGQPLMMRLARGPSGYLLAQLGSRAKRRNHRVHRLVLMAFDRMPLDGEQCRHLNGDPTDNRRENLAWGTGFDNAQDMIRHGRHPKLNATHCVRGHPFDLANTMIVRPKDRNPRRVCRACKALARKQSRVRKRAA